VKQLKQPREAARPGTCRAHFLKGRAGLIGGYQENHLGAELGNWLGRATGQAMNHETEEEITMSFTQRVYFGNPVQGRFRVNWQIPGVINSDSVVVITASEYNPEDVPPGFNNERRRFLGDANIWVSNISPHGDGSPNFGVEFAINVDFPTPLFVVVDITVLDPPQTQNVFHI
jgi:hypothetical protein